MRFRRLTKSREARKRAYIYQRAYEESLKVGGRMPCDEAETKGTRVRDLRESRQVRVGEYVKRRKALENFVRGFDVACRLSSPTRSEARVFGTGAELSAWIRSKVKPSSIHHIWIIRPAFRLSPRLLAKFMCRRSLRPLPTLSANSSSSRAPPRRLAITISATLLRYCR